MKLLKLEILNLASLDKKDGEVINFEEGALGETSIFSIVGPTGSGKSTLLDAICLALYNRAPRYPRKKGDRNQNIEIYGAQDETEKNRLAPSDGRNILTRGKKDGYSKLTFLANNGKIYRAEWHVHFSVKKYSEQEMYLFELLKTATGFDEKQGEWDKLPQIIGLDYEQFLRTVLIAQGSFANFLTAKENERYELLEKLIGCEEMYTNIAQKIKERRDEALEQFNEVNAKVDAIKQYVIDDEETLNALKEEYNALEEAEKKINEQIQVIDSAIKWYSEDLQLQKTLTNHKAEEEKARLALETIQDNFKRLSLHDALLPATDILREIKSRDKSIKDASAAIAKIESEIPALNEAIAVAEIVEAIDIVEHIQKYEEEINTISERQQELTQENATAAEKLRNLAPEIESLDNEVKGLTKAYTLITSENWSEHRADLEEGKACPLCGSKHHPYSDTDSQELSEATLALKKSLEEKITLLKKMQSEEVSLSGKLKKNEGELAGIANRLKCAPVELAEYEQKWNVVAEKHKDWQKDKQSLVALANDFQKIKSDGFKKTADIAKL